MISAVNTWVPTCQMGRAKIRAPQRTAVHNTIVHATAPSTTAPASRTELANEGALAAVCWLPTTASRC